MTESRSSHETSGSDPFELWRQFYSANEEMWTKAMKDMITTPDYAEAQGKMLEIFLSYQKYIRETMSSQLSTMNLPSGDDVARLGELIVGLEEKVDQSEEEITGLLEELVKKTDRLQDRITSLDKRAEEFEKKVRQLDDRVATFGKSLERQVEAAEARVRNEREKANAQRAAGAQASGAQKESERKGK